MRLLSAISRLSYKASNRYLTTTTTNVADEVRCERLSWSETGIALFRLNRPQAKNALGRTFIRQLFGAIDAVKVDKSVRVVIVKSDVHGAFCAGADLKERAKMSDEEVSQFGRQLTKVMRELEQLPMPVIAALDGVALGGGLEMSLACDLRVAADTAKMGLVETRLAIIPGAGGTQRLPRLVGSSIAKELIFTGRIIDGAEAYKLGIVNTVVAQLPEGDAAFQKSLDLAKEILPSGPIALRMAKMAISRGIEVDIDTGMEIERLCYEQIVPTKDRLEGLAAFKEKRTPQFKGE